MEEQVQQGVFRDDLYYRLRVIQLTTPPLRDRGPDVLLLADHFIRQLCRRYGKDDMPLSEAAQEVLMQHPWPGNVRELRNVLEQAVLLSPHQIITPAQLPFITGVMGSAPTGRTETGRVALPSHGLVMDEVERDLVQQALERTNWNATQAAKLLGMTRDMLRYRIDKFCLSKNNQSGTPI